MSKQGKSDRHWQWDVFPLAYSLEPVKVISEHDKRLKEIFTTFQKWLFARLDADKKHNQNNKRGSNENSDKF